MANINDIIKKHALPRWLTLSAAIVGLIGVIPALLAPVIYLCGLVYDYGYLHTYGVSYEFFIRSLQEYYAIAYFGLLGIINFYLPVFFEKFLWAFPLIVFVVAGLVVVLVHVENTTFIKNLKLRVQRPAWPKLFKHLTFPILAAALAWLIPIFLVATVILILVLPGLFYYRGEAEANRQIEQAKPCSYSLTAPSNCVFLIENGKLVAGGIVVARNSTHLALFNEGRTRIYPMKDQLIEAVLPKKERTAPAK